MKISELGPAVLDGAIEAGKGIHARAKALFVALDDILKTVVNAAFFLFLEFEKAKATRPESRIRLDGARRHGQ